MTTRVCENLRQAIPMLVLTLLIGMLAFVEGVSPLAVLALAVLVVLVALVFPQQRAQEPVVEREARVEPAPSRIALLAAAYAALDMPTLLLDQDGNVVGQNEAAVRMFGAFPPDTHLSGRLRSPVILDMVRETMSTRIANQGEHSERLPSERVHIVRVAPVDLGAMEEDEPADPHLPAQRFFVLTYRDISELRLIDRMRSDFVANASHELRTPLASLRGFIETLLGPARDDAQARTRFLNIMLDQATRMSRLLDDLLSLSRLELKAHMAPSDTIELLPLLAHVRDSLLPLAAELDVKIDMEVPDRKIEVVGDRDELVQVFENLIENACKYGQEGKLVEVKVTGGDNAPVEVAVLDKGPGIAAEHVPRLTERFYRVSVEASRSKKGTGLGLAIVKHILTRHRARLIVKSSLGQGTAFIVRF